MMTLRTNNMVVDGFVSVDCSESFEDIQNIFKSGASRIGGWMTQYSKEIAEELKAVGIDKNALNRGVDLLKEADKRDLVGQAEAMIWLLNETIEQAKHLYGTDFGQKGWAIRSTVSGFKMFLNSLISDINRKGFSHDTGWYDSLMNNSVNSFTDNMWKDESIVAVVCMAKAIEGNGRVSLESNWR